MEVAFCMVKLARLREMLYICNMFSCLILIENT